VFVPQIAMLFLFLAILEDSGYLARAAFLMDKLLSKVGLHGKSFIPLLSSFACAIPGIMATRTIENRKDRLATIFVAPFMSCGARPPVYFLLIGLFFAGYSPFVQGGIMFGLYATGVVAAMRRRGCSSARCSRGRRRRSSSNCRPTSCRSSRRWRARSGSTRASSSRRRAQSSSR
jgi:Fe2+ transport system protein B